ncbi:MAG TPA: hypothetical protein VJ833_07880 [Rhodanobacteraceae bacterium]|nr:hypothetical protein [Rhodanobacteraceae bacterium]
MPVTEDLLQVSEVNVMKLSAISIAIVLAGIAGVASAAGQSKIMQPVTVSSAGISACTPPNDTTGHACDAFNQVIRANFSRREIGMLFGASTSYPEYVTGGIDHLQRRYQAVLQEYVAAQQAASKADIAAK